jgi:hypothetical protein
MKSGE